MTTIVRPAHVTAGSASRPLRVAMLVGSASVAGGGVSEAVRHLSLALHRLNGASVEVLSLDDGPAERLDFADVPVRRFRIVGPSAFGYAPDLLSAMLKHDFDLVHVHGLWMYLSVAATRWRRRSGRPYLVSPHGMLDPWALRHRSWKKKIARLAFEDEHLSRAACLHALCAAEAAGIRSAGIATRVAVIPNGVEPPASAPGLPARWRENLPADAKVLLFLGRVTPKKCVLELIRAWSRVRMQNCPWHLVIVGPVDEAYGHRLRALVAATQCQDHVHLVGPAYGDERAAAYASSDAFMLPSVSEGLPMAALEAFAWGLPALLTRQCNLPESFDCDAAIEIQTGESGIADALRQLFAMSAARRDTIGQNARQLAARTFSWQRVASLFAGLYGEIDAAGSRSDRLAAPLSDLA